MASSQDSCTREAKPTQRQSLRTRVPTARYQSFRGALPNRAATPSPEELEETIEYIQESKNNKSKVKSHQEDNNDDKDEWSIEGMAQIQQLPQSPEADGGNGSPISSSEGEGNESKSNLSTAKSHQEDNNENEDAWSIEGMARIQQLPRSPEADGSPNYGSDGEGSQSESASELGGIDGMDLLDDNISRETDDTSERGSIADHTPSVEGTDDAPEKTITLNGRYGIQLDRRGLDPKVIYVNEDDEIVIPISIEGLLPTVLGGSIGLKKIVAGLQLLSEADIQRPNVLIRKDVPEPSKAQFYQFWEYYLTIMNSTAMELGGAWAHVVQDFLSILPALVFSFDKTTAMGGNELRTKQALFLKGDFAPLFARLAELIQLKNQEKQTTSSAEENDEASTANKIIKAINNGKMKQVVAILHKSKIITPTREVAEHYGVNVLHLQEPTNGEVSEDDGEYSGNSNSLAEEDDAEEAEGSGEGGGDAASPGPGVTAEQLEGITVARVIGIWISNGTRQNKASGPDGVSNKLVECLFTGRSDDEATSQLQQKTLGLFCEVAKKVATSKLNVNVLRAMNGNRGVFFEKPNSDKLRVIRIANCWGNLCSKVFLQVFNLRDIFKSKQLNQCKNGTEMLIHSAQYAFSNMSKTHKESDEGVAHALTQMDIATAFDSVTRQTVDRGTTECDQRTIGKIVMDNMGCRAKTTLPVVEMGSIQSLTLEGNGDSLRQGDALSGCTFGMCIQETLVQADAAFADNIYLTSTIQELPNRLDKIEEDLADRGFSIKPQSKEILVIGELPPEKTDELTERGYRLILRENGLEDYGFMVMGTPIGSNEYISKMVRATVNTIIENTMAVTDLLADVAPKELLLYVSQSVLNQFSYLNRTTALSAELTVELVEAVDTLINDVLQRILNQEELAAETRLIMALPFREGGLGMNNPFSLHAEIYLASLLDCVANGLATRLPARLTVADPLQAPLPDHPWYQAYHQVIENNPESVTEVFASKNPDGESYDPADASFPLFHPHDGPLIMKQVGSRIVEKKWQRTLTSSALAERLGNYLRSGAATPETKITQRTLLVHLAEQSTHVSGIPFRIPSWSFHTRLTAEQFLFNLRYRLRIDLPGEFPEKCPLASCKTSCSSGYHVAKCSLGNGRRNHHDQIQSTFIELANSTGAGYRAVVGSPFSEAWNGVTPVAPVEGVKNTKRIRPDIVGRTGYGDFVTLDMSSKTSAGAVQTKVDKMIDENRTNSKNINVNEIVSLIAHQVGMKEAMKVEKYKERAKNQGLGIIGLGISMGGVLGPSFATEFKRIASSATSTLRTKVENVHKFMVMRFAFALMRIRYQAFCEARGSFAKRISKQRTDVGIDPRDEIEIRKMWDIDSQ